MSWRDKRPLKPFEWGFLVLLLAVLLYVAASLWGVVAGGLPNLGRALADGEIRFAVGLSLWTTTLSTLLCILIGIPCAYLLAFTPLPGKRWPAALLELPLALPYLVLGLCLLTLFSSPFGKALKELGLRLVFDPKGIVAVHLLINLPFVIHLATQAFRQIDPELPLTAQTLGATRFQAFTDAPAQFEGSLDQVLALDLEGDPHSRGLFIATLNAVMKYLGRADNTVHCRDGGPELCARHMVEWVSEHYGTPKIALVGFQPALIAALSQRFPVKVLDLNPDNIGKVKDGCPVLDGVAGRREAVDWADLVLCTGSTLCNGTIVDYLDLDKEVVFFGTTLAGAAPILGLKRACFADRTMEEQ